MAAGDPWEVSEEELALLVTGRTIPAKSSREKEIARANSIFQENLPVAAAVICEIMSNDPSSRNRLAAAKYVADRVLGRIGDARPVDSDTTYDFINSILREPTAAERASGRSVTRD